jgi:hypothetical protein
VTIACFSGLLPAQEPKGQPAIRVGGSIKAATEAFRKAGKEFHPGGMSILKLPDDEDYYCCTLDEEHAFIAVFFSKSSEKITSIAARLFQQKKRATGTDVWIDAKNVTLHEDGSYSIHFLPAKKKPDASPKRRSVYPGEKSND